MPLFRPHRKPSPDALPLGSTPRAITRAALDSALANAASSYPNEFGGVLRADPPGVISEILHVPGTTAGRRHANFQLYMLPVDLTVVGTVHSHPSGALQPSDADLRLFRSWGRRHLILGRPFAAGSWRAYDGNGEETRIAVVESRRDLGTERPLRTYRPHPRGRGKRAPAFPEDEA